MRSTAYVRFLVIWVLAGSLAMSGCSDEPTEILPVVVNWTGQVRDGYQDLPIPDQEVLLVQTALRGLWLPALVFEDTLQTTHTDGNGYFSFTFTDPNVMENWYSVHTHHPDYVDQFIENRNHPALESYYEDIVLKPKAWLKIRVLDVPEQNVSETGITFINLNVDDNIWFLSTNTLSIHPSNGDTTFFAFKPGGELTTFAYYNSDSMATVAYEGIFPPFDTTALLFTY